jgi:hypothetical protein
MVSIQLWLGLKKSNDPPSAVLVVVALMLPGFVAGA